MSVINEIARQLHIMRPDWVRPGENVVMKKQEPNGLSVAVRRPLEDGTIELRQAFITYEANDTYTVSLRTPDGAGGHKERCSDNLYADQLGEIVWGPDAKAFSEPMIEIFEWNEDETLDEALARRKPLP